MGASRAEADVDGATDPVTRELPAAEPVAPPAPLRGRRRFLLGLLTGAVLMAGGGLFASTFIKSPQQVASEAAPPPPTMITVPVAERVLKQTVVLRGTVAPERAVDVKPVLGDGRSVITRKVVATGDNIGSGSVLAEISGRPVIGLRGRIPPYREIGPGMKGPDVEQLQSALRGLGYRITDERGEFGASTQRVLRQMYRARDYDPPLRAVKTEATETGTTAPEPEFEVYVPMSELVYIATFPAQVTAVKKGLGAEVDGSILTLSLGGLVVRGNLVPADRELVETGMPVEIYHETSDEKVPGKVDTIGELRQSSAAGGGGEQGNGHPIEVRGTKAIPMDFAGEDVRLTVTAATTGEAVLVVPVSAVFSAADGSTQVLRIVDGDRREPVTVRIGASSGGFVQVTAHGLSKGDRVLVGERMTTGGEAPEPQTTGGGDGN